MPGPSGLEAIKLAKEISPFTRYYIMTGFDEFEYAKQAIRLKVDDYLMKPLDIKTIRETLTAARLHVHLNLEHKKNTFRTWLESSLNRRDSYFGEYAGHYCSLLLVNIDGEDVPPEEIERPFKAYDSHLVSVFNGDSLVLLCFSEKSEYILEMYRELAAYACPRGLTCMVSSVTRDPAELKNALWDLSDRSCLRVLLGLGRFYHLAPLMDRSRAELDFCRSCLKWRDAFADRDYTAFTGQSEPLVNQLFKSAELQRHLDEILDFMALAVKSDQALPRDPAALKDYLSRTARDLLSGPTEDSKVQSIIRFIQEHYRENISAAELSERFGLSANYISNLLKASLGIRYNDYVTQLRLNHAKELLLSTRLSVKEITTACGYYSQSHFTKLFLEHMGCTPAEYRKAKE